MEQRDIHFEAAPIRSIMAPLDGSKLAEAAIPPALAIASGLDATVLFVHVLEQDAPARVHGEPHLATVSAATHYLDELAQRHRSAGVPIDTHVHENPERNVSGAIAAHGAELHSDLIVLAAHGTGGLGGLLFGRIAEQIVRRGPNPVVVVPNAGHQTAEPFGCAQFAVMLSGSPESEAVIPVAMTIANALSANLHLISAVPTRQTLDPTASVSLRVLPSFTREFLESVRTSTVAYLANVSAAIQRSGTRATAAVVRGDPVEASIDQATAAGACLLALATHGRQGLGEILDAGIGARVLTRFGGPLLFVRLAG